MAGRVKLAESRDGVIRFLNGRMALLDLHRDASKRSAFDWPFANRHMTTGRGQALNPFVRRLYVSQSAKDAA